MNLKGICENWEYLMLAIYEMSQCVGDVFYYFSKLLKKDPETEVSSTK